MNDEVKKTLFRHFKADFYKQGADRKLFPLSKRRDLGFNPFTATGYFDIPPPRWPTFLAMLFPILKEGMGLSLLDEFEVQYHVIKK